MISKKRSITKRKRNLKQLSVVLATRNEEENIARCLKSVKNIADEMIVVDEMSEDNTVAIARNLGAQVYEFEHQENFHKTKQCAIEKAKCKWILQLDADEAVSAELAKEIRDVVSMPEKKLLLLKEQNLQHSDLFRRHQKLLEERDGKLGKDTGEVVAFFIPRVNMFLGKPLIHGGVYPDGVIRLIKRGKATLPAKSVHEQMKIDGEVAWLVGNLEHYDSPTFTRYIWRNNRYTNLMSQELKDNKVSKSFIGFSYFVMIRPFITFIDLYVRHKGFLDGYRGFIWCYFSSLRFAISYVKYLRLP